MALESGLGSFNPGNVIFGETAGIQCACIALYAVSYSTLKEVNRWDQFDLHIILINGNTLYKTSHRQLLLRWVKKLYLHNFKKINMEFSIGVLQEVHAALLEI